MDDIKKFCVVCGNQIDPERVEILPDTELCITHAKRADQFGGEFSLQHTPKNTGKQGSLKKNYGSVDISKNRNWTALDRLQAEEHGRGEEE